MTFFKKIIAALTPWRKNKKKGGFDPANIRLMKNKDLEPGTRHVLVNPADLAAAEQFFSRKSTTEEIETEANELGSEDGGEEAKGVPTMDVKDNHTGGHGKDVKKDSEHEKGKGKEEPESDDNENDEYSDDNENKDA